MSNRQEEPLSDDDGVHKPNKRVEARVPAEMVPPIHVLHKRRSATSSWQQPPTITPGTRAMRLVSFQPQAARARTNQRMTHTRNHSFTRNYIRHPRDHTAPLPCTPHSTPEHPLTELPKNSDVAYAVGLICTVLRHSVTSCTSRRRHAR